MLGDEALKPALHRVRQRIISGARVGILRIAAVGPRRPFALAAFGPSPRIPSGVSAQAHAQPRAAARLGGAARAYVLRGALGQNELIGSEGRLSEFIKRHVGTKQHLADIALPGVLTLLETGG